MTTKTIPISKSSVSEEVQKQPAGVPQQIDKQTNLAVVETKLDAGDTPTETWTTTVIC